MYSGERTSGYVEGVLVMEYIEGFKLMYEDWIQFTEEERAALCARLAEQYRLLRSIPSEGYYGRIHRQAFDRNMGMFRTNGLQSCGPYETYEEFTAAVARSGEVIATTSRLPRGEYLDEDQVALLSEYKLALEASTDRKPVFTHVDPGPKNILIRRIPGTQDHPPDFEVTLIDWAGAGWFPPWVQRAAFEQRCGIFDSSGRGHGKDAMDFMGRVCGDMQCGAELVDLCSRVRMTIAQRIY